MWGQVLSLLLASAGEPRKSDLAFELWPFSADLYHGDDLFCLELSFDFGRLENEKTTEIEGQWCGCHFSYGRRQRRGGG